MIHSCDVNIDLCHGKKTRMKQLGCDNLVYEADVMTAAYLFRVR